ncbi:hypothetical protein VYA_39790 [Vibrio alfacsensis]|nr:hypothetical protein VYA_39790 [Vibrio alfacsensis]
MRLSGIVSEAYAWPQQPHPEFHLEFIVCPGGELALDFLCKKRAMFWSEFANEVFETPVKQNGEPITWQDLMRVGIPFMS